VRPRQRGVLQSPPLPVVVELGKGRAAPPPGLAERIEQEIRARLVVTTEVSWCGTARCPARPTRPA
jgi:phenylacetate-CoA ligase